MRYTYFNKARKYARPDVYDASEEPKRSGTNMSDEHCEKHEFDYRTDTCPACAEISKLSAELEEYKKAFEKLKAAMEARRNKKP